MLANTQDMLQMCSSFDASKSTKGASKLRRDLINAEISNLRDLLPLPSSTRQRLSQLQLMALVCVYVRKANYFHQVFRKQEVGMEVPTSNFGFSKALSGFLMMMTQNGKLLYISDNAAEYLGHSMEDLLIHGDSVYDIVDKQDHPAVQAELNRAIASSSSPSSSSTTSSDHHLHHHHLHHQQPQHHHHQHQHHHHQHHHQHHHHHQVHHQFHPLLSSADADQRIFLCRMNVSRNARRQMRFGDQKVVLVQGHFLSFLPLCSRNEPVFLATCTPVAMPETRECVAHGSTNIFTSLHTMDMKFVHLDKNGEFHLGYSKENVQGLSWYQLIHWENIREAQSKHRLSTTPTRKQLLSNLLPIFWPWTASAAASLHGLNCGAGYGPLLCLSSLMDQDRSCILLLRLQARSGAWIWVHVVLQVKENTEGSQQPVIVCTNQVLGEREASVMQANTWLYHYYTVQSKLQYSLAFESRVTPTSATMPTAPTPYYAPLVPYPPHRHPHPPPPPPPPPHLYPTTHSAETPLQHPSLFHHHPGPGTTSLNGASHQHHQQHQQHQQEHGHNHHHHSSPGTYHQLPLSVGYHPNFSTTKSKVSSDRGLAKQRRLRRRRSSWLQRNNISDSNDDDDPLVARVTGGGAGNGGGVVHAVMMACMPRHSPHKEAVHEEDGWSSPTSSAALVAVHVAYQTVPDLYEDMKRDILSDDHRAASECNARASSCSNREGPPRQADAVAVVPNALWSSDDLGSSIASSSSSSSPPSSFHSTYNTNSWLLRHLVQEPLMVASSLCCCDNSPKLCRWHLGSTSSGPDDAISSGDDSIMTSPTPRACRIGDEVIG